MFEKIYCINLPERTDRWEECTVEFEKVGLKVERHEAVKPFNVSQFECIKKASRYKSSLILEDDVEFKDWSYLQSAYDSLPDDWDIISLGATLKSKHKERVGDHLYRYKDGWATQAVGYSQKMMEWLVKNFDPMNGTIYDEWLRLNVLKQFNCYIVYPMVCFQRPSFSDLRNRFIDYTKGFEDSEKLFI